MEQQQTIRVLLVEDNRDFARLVEYFLKKHTPEVFEVVWKENGQAALAELARDPNFDAILMDYFLPQQNGLEVTRLLQERQIRVPVIFLTVNKDFDLAVEVIKLGVEDYLVKEEIGTLALPKTVLSVIERQRLLQQLTSLEVTQKRLEAIAEIVMTISHEIREPLERLRANLEQLSPAHASDSLTPYLTIIRENLNRLESKITRLKGLKSDKTVQYIQDIRMIDLSE
jgi:DNA-binding NarL/FixJ family response regulator